MDLNAGHYWKSLITRYGPPLEPESLDTDTLRLAVAERRDQSVIGIIALIRMVRNRNFL